MGLSELNLQKPKSYYFTNLIKFQNYYFNPMPLYIQLKCQWDKINWKKDSRN